MSQDLAATSGVTEVEERSPSLLSRLLAETFGTFLLTLVIVGVLVYSPLNSTGGVGIALASAFAYIAGAAAVGRVSGAHFNPAISLGALLTGRISVGTMFSYWGAQLVGAVLAATVLFATLPQALVELLGQATRSDTFDGAVNGFGTHSPLYLQTQGGAQFDLWPALAVEFIIAAILVGVYLSVNDSRSKIGNAPAAVGITIAALTLVSWFVTNAGLNPAISTATALFANDWGSDGSGPQLWLFWVAPLIGAAVAALFYRAFGTEESDSADADELDVDEDDDDDDEVEETELVAAPVAAEPVAPEAEVTEEKAEAEKKADDKA